MKDRPWTHASNYPVYSVSTFGCYFLATLSVEAFLTLGFYYYSDYSVTLATGFLAAFLGLTSSSDSSDEDSFLTAFLATTALTTGDLAFCKGDLVGFFGASSSDSSDDDSTFFFWTCGFWSGDFVAFLTGFTYSYELSSLSTFLATTLAALAGTTFFLGCYYSELSSLDSAFFLATTALSAGDLALTTFLGASSSLDSSLEDYFFFFLSTETFRTGPDSALTTLVAFFWTFSVYSSIDYFLALVATLALTTGVDSSSLDYWTGFFLTYFLALKVSFLATIKGSSLDESASESWI